MDSKILMLGAASIVAFSTSPSLEAATLRPTGLSAETGLRATGSSNALINFVVGTGGHFGADAVEAGLRAAFGNLSSASARDIPGFFKDLMALEVTLEVRQTVYAGLLGIIDSASLPGSERTFILNSLSDIIGGRFGAFQIVRGSEGMLRVMGPGPSEDCNNSSTGCHIGNAYNI